MEPSDMALLATLDALLQEGSVTGAARRVGLSVPAMSHALARIRLKMDDPLLVRSGRGMVLTPRAIALKPRVNAVVNEARLTLEKERPFVAHELSRTFVVHATDYVLSLLGTPLDRILVEESPHVSLRFLPNTQDDGLVLREGDVDLAIGIYGDLPQEMRSRQLLTDRFVCAIREGHASIGKRLTLDDFVRVPHVQIAPRGKPGGYVDDVLRERGLVRRVARAVPYFLTALELVSRTDYLLVVSERVAREHAPSLGLRLFDVPIALRPYALSTVWHPRFDADPGHRFLRQALVRAAQLGASEVHERPRTRLDPSDPTSGRPREPPRPPKSVQPAKS